MSSSTAGCFIVFEGIDGAGKSSQARRLAERLQERGAPVGPILFEPTRGRHGQELRRLMREGRRRLLWRTRELLLFWRDRRENLRTNVLPALGRGEVVLQDRYYYSTMAYQGALGFPMWLIRWLHWPFPRPDRTLLIDLSAEEGVRRIREGRQEEANHFEKLEYLQEVRRRFCSFSFPGWHRVDGTRSEAEVAAACFEAVLPVVRSYFAPGGTP